MSKNLSGGIMPISVTCIREKLKDVFKEDPLIHPSPFGGLEISCEVAYEVLK